MNSKNGKKRSSNKYRYDKPYNCKPYSCEKDGIYNVHKKRDDP